MKKIMFFLIFSLAAFVSNAQIKLNTSPDATSFFIQPSYPLCDTIKCLFLELTDSAEKWSKGYVVRNNGMIEFGNTRVSPEYLPVTSAIVTSTLFYEDKTKITNKAIHVILLSQQTNK